MANIDNTFHNGGYTLRISYTVNSQSVANNSSNVTVAVHLISKGSGYNISSSTSKSGTLSINGTAYSFSASVSLSSGEDKTLFTKTVDVPHNSDGTKTCALSCSLAIQVTLSGTYYGTVSCSGNATFATIARATSVTTSGTYKFGTAMTITHSRASTDFTITLRYGCGNSSGTIVSKVSANSTSWTPPKSLQSEIPSATSIGITVYCDTYSGSTLIGTTSTSFTCTIADDCVPSISAGSFTNPSTSGTTYWQTVSQVRAEFTVAGAYGSTISKYVMTVDGQTITNYGYIIWSGTLTGSGAKDIGLTITDSRGRTATKTFSSAITVTAYSKPSITKFTCKRTGTDESGTEVISNLGTIGYFTYACSWHSTSSSKTRKFMYKPTTSSSWTSVSISANSYTDYQFSTALSSGSAYDLRIQLSDQVTTVTMDIKMNNLFPLINLSADGTAIAFGKECNASNKFMVSMNASFNNDVDIYNLNVTGTTFTSGTALKLTTSGDVGTYYGNQIWLSSCLCMSSTGSNGTLYFNSAANHTNVDIYGTTKLRGRGSNNQIVVVETSGDGNTAGDGNTHLGYYDANLGGYCHYFRGEGAFHIDTANAYYGSGEIITNRNNYPTYLWSGTLSSSGSITLTNGLLYKSLIVGVRPSGATATIAVLCPKYWITAGMSMQGCTESSYVKFTWSTSGNNAILTWNGGGSVLYVGGIM